ncbi:MAG: ATP-binding cassette domain-containing protein [Gaiellaceae bacterium]
MESALLAGAGVGALLYVALAGRAARTYTLRAPAALGAGVAIGASEEVIWRGFALSSLSPSAGRGLALAISTVGFAASHYAAQRARGVCVHLGTGLVFGTLFALTGSLAAAATAHGLYNLLALAGRAPIGMATSVRRTATSAVEMRAVEKRYGRLYALQGVSLTIAKGEIVALLGPNGAGKTTLVCTLLGLRRVDSGDIRVFGAEPGTQRARHLVGATPQEMSFPPTLRVREIVDFVQAHHPPGDGADVVRQFGLAEIARRQTGGLSGGQRRRLAVALAFVGAPRLAVLDEPTAGLDVESRLQVWDAVRTYAANGGTALVTTHSLQEAESLASRIVVLVAGRIVGDGTASALRLPGEASLEDAYLRLTREAR